LEEYMDNPALTAVHLVPCKCANSDGSDTACGYWGDNTQTSDAIARVTCIPCLRWAASRTERRDPKADAQRAALDAIIQERSYQKTRWKPEHDKDHTPEDWHIILSVWMGKLANETPLFQGESFYDKKKYLKRLAQVGAIAAAAYEALSALPD
jgi:hypothetical protein